MNDKPRIIFLNGSVDAASSMKVIIQLLAYEQEDNEKEIKLYINSNGGSIDYGLAIYDTIRFIKVPVATVCYGMAASMGAFLLSCGKKGRRFALPHSRILIHQPLIQTKQGSIRTQTSLQRCADNIQKSRDELERILSDNTGKPIETIHVDCERDNWMSAEEAVQYGLIDTVIQK